MIQGVIDGYLEYKPGLQLPLDGHEHCFLILGYQREFLEITGMVLSPHLLEDIIATLLEEDRIFRSYADAHHLEQMVSVCIVYFVTIDRNRSCTFWVWLVFHQYLALLVLTTYGHKCKYVCLRYNNWEAFEKPLECCIKASVIFIMYF